MRKNSLFYNFPPENAFIFIGTIFGILFLLITPPFQVPDEPSHFYRAFYVSEFGVLAQKLDNKSTKSGVAFWVRRDGTFIEAKAKEDANMHVRRSVYEAVPAEVAHKIMYYVGRALETGDQQIFKFQLIEKNSKIYKYEARITKIKEDEVLAGVHEITSVSGRVGEFLPESLVATLKVMDDVAFHPKKKQNVDEIFSLLKLPLSPDNKSFVEFPNTALYTPLPYLPQAFGIALGRIFNFSPLILVYIGRIFNLFAWIFLVYLAIKTTPISKWLIFLLALTPMSLFQASSLSADAFTNGVAFLLIALFLLYSFDKAKTIKRVDILIIFLLSLLLSLVDNQKGIAIHFKEKVLMAMVLFSTMILISTMMYLTWTPVGGNIIEGIQGRYFIPVAPLFFLLFYNKKISFKIQRFSLVIMYCSLLTLSFTLFVLFRRYYL